MGSVIKAADSLVCQDVHAQLLFWQSSVISVDCSRRRVPMRIDLMRVSLVNYGEPIRVVPSMGRMARTLLVVGKSCCLIPSRGDESRSAGAERSEELA